MITKKISLALAARLMVVPRPQPKGCTGYDRALSRVLFCSSGQGKNMSHQAITKPVFIDHEHIKEVLKYEDLLPVIERAFVDFSDHENGGIVQPVRSMVPVTKHSGMLYTMPGYSARENALVTKLVSFYTENEQNYGLPSHIATILYFDSTTGMLKAIMDGALITDMRTAAASAIATKHLAKEDAKVLCILGSGAVARSHVEALKSVRSFSEVRVWSRTRGNADKFAQDFNAKAYSTAEEAVRGADVIVTCTSSPTPVLYGQWVKKGTLINAVGAARPTWRELDDDLLHNSTVIADSRDGVMKESGDILLSKAKVAAELGEVIAGKFQVDKEKTNIFKSLGMAVEDVVTANLVYNKLHASKS